MAAPKVLGRDAGNSPVCAPESRGPQRRGCRGTRDRREGNQHETQTRKREGDVARKDGVNSTGQMISCRFGEKHGRGERPYKDTQVGGVGANGAFNVETATVDAVTCGTVPWGATLKAPFVQTRGNALSGPPGKNHLSHTAPFPFALRHRGLVNNHHRAPPTCPPVYLCFPSSLLSSWGRTVPGARYCRPVVLHDHACPPPQAWYTRA